MCVHDGLNAVDVILRDSKVQTSGSIKIVPLPPNYRDVLQNVLDSHPNTKGNEKIRDAICEFLSQIEDGDSRDALEALIKLAEGVARHKKISHHHFTECWEDDSSSEEREGENDQEKETETVDESDNDGMCIFPDYHEFISIPLDDIIIFPTEGNHPQGVSGFDGFFLFVFFFLNRIKSVVFRRDFRQDGGQTRFRTHKTHRDAGWYPPSLVVFPLVLPDSPRRHSFCFIDGHHGVRATYETRRNIQRCPSSILDFPVVLSASQRRRRCYFDDGSDHRPTFNHRCCFSLACDFFFLLRISSTGNHP